MKSLILAPFDPLALGRMREGLEVIYESWMDTGKLQSPEELAERIETQNIGILIVEADFLFEEVFENVTKLCLVGVCRNSVDHIDVVAATKHRVLVVNAPARNAVSVAELTIGLMLSLARRIPQAHSMVKEGKWLDPVGPYISMRGMELAGKTAGVIGLGRIGSEVVKRLCAFDMDILVYDPFVERERVSALGAKKTTLEELMSSSDFITLHCSLSPETEGMLDEQKLSLMKPTAYLINTASWEIIEEKALIHALQQRHIAGAAFDVYETHPLSLQSPLLRLDNVLLTPHIGGATDGTLKRYSHMLIRDIKRFLVGKRPQNLVNPEAWTGNDK